MTCLANDTGTLHICRVEGEWKKTKRRPRRRWCFTCRAYTIYELWLYCPTGLSWYGPTPAWKCRVCKKEDDLFPGWSRTWDE